MPGMLAPKKRPIPGFASGTANVQQPFSISDILGPSVPTPQGVGMDGPTIAPVTGNSTAALTAALNAGSRMPLPASPVAAPAPVPATPQGGFGGPDLAAAVAPRAPAVPAYAPATSLARWGVGSPAAAPAAPAAPPVIPQGNQIRWAARVGTPEAIPAPAVAAVPVAARPRFSTQDAQYLSAFIPRQPMPNEIAQRDLMAVASSNRDQALANALATAKAKPGFENQPQNEPGYQQARQLILGRYLEDMKPILNPLAALYPNTTPGMVAP